MRGLRVLLKKGEQSQPHPRATDGQGSIAYQTIDIAFIGFMRTNMDYLIVGNFLLEKSEQKPLDKGIDWLREFELD